MALSKEKKKLLNAAMAKINKKFGEDTVKLVGEHLEEMKVKYYETPSLEINEMLNGGMVVGKVIELFGENSCGKTSLALETIAHNQKKDPEFMAGFFETEESYDPEYAAKLGVDLDRMVYWDQREHGAEKGLDILGALVASGQFNMIVINSVAGLSPQKERDGEMIDVGMALQARMMSKLFRVITGSAAKNGCTLVFINQIRASMDMYKPDATSGGKALGFYSSQRVSMRKVKIQAADPILEDQGVKINTSSVKNRYANGTNPYKKCTYYAEYGKGINRIIAIPEIMVNAGILRKAGSWLYWEDENGVPITVAGVECKFQSRKILIDVLTSNTEFFEAAHQAISDKIKKGEAKGQSMTPEEIAMAKEVEEALKEGMDEEDDEVV